MGKYIDGQEVAGFTAETTINALFTRRSCAFPRSFRSLRDAEIGQATGRPRAS
jgi:hypothetical protein